MSAILLDRLRAVVQVDVNQRGLARDRAENLFTACRPDFASACASIAGTPDPALAIVTGFYIPHADPPCGETDGPLGAVFLARALQPRGIRLTLLTDDFCRPALETGLHACGLSECVPLITLPHQRMQLAGRGSPWTPPSGLTHLIALERVGPGRDNRYRNMRAVDVTEQMAPAHLLFEDAAQRTPALITIGIGDGGNEIGMGKINPRMIGRNITHGDLIACRVPTDHLIVAGVSNWGAYALAAGVAVLRGERLPAALFDVETERELLRRMVEQGPLVDGVTARPTISVDGLAFEEYIRPLRQIGQLLGVA
jgi:hypothetical protein